MRCFDIRKRKLSTKSCFLMVVSTVTLLMVLLPYTVLPVFRSLFVPDEIILPEGICSGQKDTETGESETNSCTANFIKINTEVLGEKLIDFQPSVINGRYLICPLLRTLDMITKALTDAEIPYFIHSGTLLGSWRHHGFIPWDHDTDISVSWESKPQIMQVFRTLPQGTGIVIKRDHHWKFFTNESCAFQNERFSFAMDVFFYHERDGYIVDDEIEIWPCLKFPRHWIFPVTYRPFNGLQLAFPARTDLVIDHCFQGEQSMNICVSNPWTNRTKVSVNCSELQDVYPFVKRSKVKGNSGCNESLTFNGSVLSWFVGNYSC